MRFFVCLLFFSSFLLSEEAPLEAKRANVMFLIYAKKIEKAIEQYQHVVAKEGQHDFELLESMGSTLLEQGMDSTDPESQLLSLYGSGVAGLKSSIGLCRTAMRGKNPTIQMAAIQILAQTADEEGADLLSLAFSSPYLPIRLEAAFALAARRHPKAVGYIEALRQKVPIQFGYLFPDLYARIGTAEATAHLKQMMNDPFIYTRLATILSTANLGRDDFIRDIRNTLTHLNPAEQEAAAIAVGLLGDYNSKEQLVKLTNSPSTDVKIAAATALLQLGEKKEFTTLVTEAKKGNTLAIAALTGQKECVDTLAMLLKSSDPNVKLNAAIALLICRDKRAIPAAKAILTSPMQDVGYLPQYSPGRSLMAWKRVPSASVQKKGSELENAAPIGLTLRERLLQEVLEFDEATFLDVAAHLFEKGQRDLIPLLTALLVNMHTENSLNLLKQLARKAGIPFCRVYASLALYKIDHSPEAKEAVLSWVNKENTTALIQFRNIVPQSDQPSKLAQFSLSPHETSRLLLECYEAIADVHNTEGIDTLLQAIHDGNNKNRYALAGLLLKALQ